MNGDFHANKAVLAIVLLIFLMLSLAMAYDSYKILILDIKPYSGKGYAAIPGALVFLGLSIWIWINRKIVSSNVLRINETGIGFGGRKNYQFFQWADIKEISINRGIGHVIKIETTNGDKGVEPAPLHTLVYKVDTEQLIEHIKDKGKLNDFSVIRG